MKMTMITLVAAAISMTASAALPIYKSFDAIYDSNNSRNMNCDEVVLGSSPEIFKSFNSDGTIDVRLNVEKELRGDQKTFIFYVKEKAFRDYFTNEVISYPAPKLVEQRGTADSILPSLRETSRNWGLINRTGYMKFRRAQFDHESLFAAEEQSLLSRTDANPAPSEIIKITKETVYVTDREIVLTVDRQFKDSDYDVPSYMKTAAWAESRKCVFTRK